MACIPKEEWMRIINEQESNGLSISQYCSLRGLSDKTFYNAKDRYKKELENPTLVHVDVDGIIQSDSKNIWFKLNGITFEFNSSAADIDIRRIIKISLTL